MNSSLNKYDSVALEASAGTGKTFQLSMRVAVMLLTGTPPKDILCLTFTNKATDEMTERIVALINNLAENKAKDEEVKAIAEAMKEYALLYKEEFGENYIRDKAIAARDRLFGEFSDLSIKTIDSFNNNILKIFPFETGLRPDFQICSEKEEQDIKTEAINEIISEILEKKDWRYIFYNLNEALEIPVNTIMEKMQEYAVFSADRPIELKNAMLKAPSEKTIKNMTEKAISLKKNILASVKEYASSFENLNGRQQKSVDRLHNVSEIKELAKEKLIQEPPDTHGYFKKYAVSGRQHDLHNDIYENISEYFSIYAKIITGLSLTLGSLLYLKIRKKKESVNKLTFKDIEERAYFTLTKENAAIDKDYIYFRLDGRINHLLIDEFQDTSASQWLILKPLAEEAMAGLGQKDKRGSFFYVGDPKQNIYRFRGGSSSLFKKVLEKYKGSLISDTLGINYRSGSNIVNAVNDISNKAAQQYPDILNAFNIDQKPTENAASGYVEITPKDPEKEFSVFAYEKVTEAVNAGWGYKDIAILVSSNKDGEKITEFLSENEVPVLLDASSKLSNSSVWTIMINLAKFIELEDDFCYLAYAATEPAAYNPDKLADNEFIKKDKFRILKILDNHNNKSIFEKLLILTEALDLQSRFNNSPDFYQITDIMAGTVPNEKNIVKFEELAGMEAANAQAMSAGDKNAVTVMTIHKSKGLQFPVVILPKIDREIKLNAQKNNLIIINADDYENARPTFVHGKDIQSFIKDESYLKNIDNENKLILQDAFNTLYVAMTRAENALIINAEQMKGDEPANLSRLLFSIIETPYIKGSLAPEKRTEAKKEARSVIINAKMTEEDITVALRENSPTLSFAASIFGTALHDTLFLLDPRNEKSKDAAIKHTIAHYGAMLNESNKEDLHKYTELIYLNKIWRGLFNGKIFKEKKSGINGSLVSIDIYSVFEDKIILADYKTGEINENVMAEYKAQLDKYETILNKLYKKPAEKIIFHFFDNKIETINMN